ncbi:MAG: hypothetical protein RL365_622 [Bacteroidota bacterium]|jgi:glycosyltransferase domain-containing protein
MNLSIVIPSRNRPSYLARAIAYYAQFDAIQLLVCDSSEQPFTGEIPKHVSYHHFPEAAFVEKIQSILPSLAKDYVVLSADDDFLLEHALNKSIDFLSANPTYSSVQGNYIAYYNLGKSLYYLPLYTQRIGKSIDFEAPLDRIASYWGSGIQLFYSVYQKEDFCKVFQTADRSIRSLNLLEYHIGLTALLLGKNKYLPVFYSVRELISNSAGTNIGLDVLVSDPNQSIQYQAFIAGVSKVFSEVQPMINDHEVIIRQQISNYLASENAKDFFSVRDRNRRIKRLMPSAVRKLIYHAWLSFNRKKNAQNNLRISSLYTGFPFGNALDESRLKQIESRILNQK